MGFDKRKVRIDAKGRNPDKSGSEDRTVILRRSFWHSPHVAALSTAARSLLVELQSMFNGTNNGELFLSVRDIAARLGFVDLAAAMSAIAELESLGLVAVTVEGSFAMKVGETSKARAFRLNWIAPDGKCVGADKLPPLDFARLTAKQKKRIAARSDVLDRYLGDQQKRKIAVRESRTLMAESVRETRTEAASTVRETRTPEHGNGGNALGHPVRESLTHILHHIPSAVPQPAGDDPRIACRSAVAGHWRNLKTAARRRSWAMANGVNFDTLHEWIIGDLRTIPVDLAMQLHSAIKAEKQAKRKAA